MRWPNRSKMKLLVQEITRLTVINNLHPPSVSCFNMDGWGRIGYALSYQDAARRLVKG
jgi:hypothetical protein